MIDLIERAESQLLDYARRIHIETKRQIEVAEMHPADYERRRKYRASVAGARKLYEGMYATARILHYATGLSTYKIIDAAQLMAIRADQEL